MGVPRHLANVVELSQNCDKLLYYLKACKEWRKSGQIVSDIGIQNDEAIRAAVHELRCHGRPILSGVKGYRYSEDPQAIAECVVNLEERAKSIHEAAGGLRRAFREYEPVSQLDIFGK